MSACCPGVKKRATDFASALTAAGEPAAGAAALCASPAKISVEGKVSGKTAAPRAVAEVFSHCLRSCFKSMGSFADMDSPRVLAGFSLSLLGRLQLVLGQLVGQVIARAPAQRHNRPGWILAAGADKGAAVHYKQILHVMRLLKLVQYRGFGIVSHARRSKFVDRPSFRKHAVAHIDNLQSRGLEHLLRCFLHVLGHIVFVLAKLVMKAQRRNAPFVFHYRIEIDEVLIARQYFSKSSHGDIRTLVFANLFLERRAKSRAVRTGRKHSASAAALKPVTTDEFRMLLRQIAEARQVKSAGPAVVERRRFPDKIGRLPGDVWPHDVLAKIVPD